MVTIIVILLCIAVLLFPIFLSIDLFFDIEKKKCFFAVYLLRFIKLHGGYITACRHGLAVHLSKKRAVIVPFGALFDTDKKFELTKGFLLYGYSHLIEIGSKEGVAAPLLAAAAVRIATCIVSVFAVQKLHCRSFKGDVACVCGQTCFKVSMRLIFLFDLALLILAGCKLFLRNLTEKKKHGKIG